MIKKSTKAHTLSLALLLASTSILSPVAYAATNPAGSTITGMEATSSDPSLENYGTISGGADYPGGWAGMFGMNDSLDFNFTNIGDIIITTTHASGTYGMYALSSSAGSYKLTNSGTIRVSGIDGVYGMSAEANNGSHSLSNSGTMTVNGNDGVYGMSAGANNNGSHTLSNSGTVNVSGNDKVYGMYVTGTGTHNLFNTGVITAKATTGKAFETYGENSYNVNTWATTLRTWSVGDAVFGADAGVNVNLDNSTLIFRPGTAAQGFALGTDMSLANLVIVGGTATDTQLGKIETEVPFLKAVVTGGTTTSTASVRLDSNISESTTPGTATMGQAVAQVQRQFNNLTTSLRNALVKIYTGANLMADAGQNKTRNLASGDELFQNKPQVFITPYVNSVDNSKYGYDGNNMGITAGASYRLSDRFYFGGHFDLSSGDYDADILNMSTDSTSIALGLHTAYNFTKEHYLRGQITGAINQNDSDYNISSATKGAADYNGEALYAELATGHIWQIDKGHSITPEIGLSYLGMWTDAYGIDFGNTIYNMSYDDSSYNALYALANIDWRSQWDLKNDGKIAVLAGFGVRQALTNSDIKTNFSTAGSKYNTISTEDSTTFLANVGIEHRKDNYSISLNYDGSYGNNQTSHGGNIMVKWDF